MRTKSVQLSNILSELPDFVFDFIRKYYDGDSINTQVAYATDIRTYLRFLLKQPQFSHIKKLEDFTPEHLEKVDLNLMLDYKVYLERYENTYTTSTGKKKTVVLTNSKKGIVRKLCTLRSLYSYLFKSDSIEKDITQKLDLPKVHHRIKKPLTVMETMNIIDVIYEGEKYLEGRELALYKKRKQRDIAIFVTLLGTGIRVSELVGLDIEDIDFDNSSLMILRKGGDNQEIPMPLQVENEIYLYLQERLEIEDAKDKNALFLSNRKRRISVSAVEKMIKKYCSLAGVFNNDKTTVHALRRTFACRLLEEGYDIKLISELLGHKDVVVTSRFYAQHNITTHRRVMQNINLPIPDSKAALNDE